MIVPTTMAVACTVPMVRRREGAFTNGAFATQYSVRQYPVLLPSTDDLRNYIHSPQRFQVVVMQSFHRVELLFHRGAIFGMRREIEDQRRHRLSVDDEAMVADFRERVCL